MALKPVEPGQLVGVLVAADGLTVWHVDADDPQVGEPGRQKTGLGFVVIVVKTPDDIAWLGAREQGHPVIRLLPAGGDSVA